MFRAPIHLVRCGGGDQAAGGYERKLVEALRAAGQRVLVLQPRDVRLFAQMRHKHAKNDRLDARVIAEFAALFGEERLVAYLPYYEQLSAAVAQAKTQLETFSDDEVCALCAEQVARLTADKRALVAASAS
ncbi:transposase [Azospirillum sp. TSO22-1]|uniref:IS110 family transposase n=1 Tax=Azospirillum sp. TSO22-1 TaxID=716789 RepID=UPI000D65574E|nr:transposase [Azospirillum sp. TSO22-1]